MKKVIEIIISIVMIILSIYLVYNAGKDIWNLIDNPDLDPTAELIRFLFGIIGIGYFGFYLLKNIKKLSNK